MRAAPREPCHVRIAWYAGWSCARQNRFVGSCYRGYRAHPIEFRVPAMPVCAAFFANSAMSRLLRTRSHCSWETGRDTLMASPPKEGAGLSPAPESQR